MREQTLARLAAFRTGLARLGAPQVAQTAMFVSTEETLDSCGAPVAVFDPCRALAVSRWRCFARCCSTSAPRSHRGGSELADLAPGGAHTDIFMYCRELIPLTVIISCPLGARADDSY